MLEKNGEVSIQEIVARCGISEITARRDFASLEERNLIKRTHGGAVRADIPAELFGFDDKTIKYSKEKNEICKLAASFIEENDTIFVDCGTTTFFLARFLTQFRNLRIITNSLSIVSELVPYPQIKVYLIGGELDNARMAFYGAMTENLLSRYKADKAFIGAGGVSLENGLSSNDEKEAMITIKMAEAANKVFLLCDSSKIEKNSYFTYSSLSLVNHVVTDQRIAPSILDLYKGKNINILIA